MPTIGASGFRFARRGSALREAVAKRDTSENQTPTVGDREGDSHPVPPAIGGTETPRLLSEEESMRRSQRLDSNQILARLGKDLSKARIDFEFQLESGSSDSADDWPEIRDSIVRPAMNLIPNAVKSEFRWKAESMGMHSDFRVREFERGLAERKALSNIRETLGHYVDLVASRPDLIDVALLKVMEPINASGLTEVQVAEQKAKANLALFRSFHQTQIDSGDLDTHERQLKNGRFKNVVSDDVVQEALESLDVERQARWLSQQASDPEARNQLSSEVQVRAEFPGERGRVMAGLMRQGQALNDAGQEVLLAAPSEVEEIRARLRNNEDVSPEALRGFELALKDRNQRIADDFRQYVETNSPVIREEQAHTDEMDARARDPSIPFGDRPSSLDVTKQQERTHALVEAEQERIKGTREGIRLLSDEQVRSDLDEIRALDPEQQVNRLWDLMDKHGSFQSRVLEEYKRGGLSHELAMIAQLRNAGRHAQARQLADAYIGQGSLPTLEDDEAKQLTESIWKNGAELLVLFGANGQTDEIRTRVEATELLATHLLQSRRGEATDDESLKRLIEEVTEIAIETTIPFQRLFPKPAGSGGGHVLLPLGIDGKPKWGLDPVKVRGCLIGIRESFQAEDLDLSKAGLINDWGLDDEYLAEHYADNIRGFGYWRNTCDGVQLLDEGGRPVVRKDGSFVALTWEQVGACKMELVGSA